MLLEPVEVVARQIIGLLDDPIAGQAAAECAKLRIDPFDLGRGEVGDLPEPGEAEGVQRVGELGPTPFIRQKSSPGSFSPSSSRRTGARSSSPVTSLVADAASPASPRPTVRAAMCGRTGALSVRVTLCLGRSRISARASATTITTSHQYSRITSIPVTNSTARYSVGEAP